jgi:hypothetical protein
VYSLCPNQLVLGGGAHPPCRRALQAVFAFGLIAYDLARLPKLLEPRSEVLAGGK